MAEHVEPEELIPDTLEGVAALCAGWEGRRGCASSAVWFVDVHGCKRRLFCNGCWAGVRAKVHHMTVTALSMGVRVRCRDCDAFMSSLSDWYPTVYRV